MDTKQKLRNTAKAYLIDDEEITFEDSYGNKTCFRQINGKLLERTIKNE